MLSVLELSGLSANLFPNDLENAIVAAAGADVYQSIYIDELDGSWENVLQSPNMLFSTGIPESTTGTDAYSITTTLPQDSYTIGKLYRFVPDVNNTGAATIEVDGLDPVAITDGAGDDLPNDTIVAGDVVSLRYDGTNMVFLTITTTPLLFHSDSQGVLRIINSHKSLRLQYQASKLLLPPVAQAATNITDTEFQANWDAVSDAVSYKLFVDGVVVYAGVDTDYTVTGLTPSTEYTYAVTAITAYKESYKSNMITVTTTS